MNKKKSKKATETKKSDKSKNLNIELQETKDKYLRLYSEFENFRRRTSKEKIEMIDSANKELLSDILPVIDDFERASNSIKKENKSDLEGYILIYQKLINTLEKYNVKKMVIKKGDEFDSEFHEAITSTPSEKKYKGKIIDVIENGYHIGDNILRFAKVVTGS
tara:strand:- start:270 stop:758 length:489 start_codon:yes stop_codon:yes gene_type:complete